MSRHHAEIEMEMLYVQRDIERLKERLKQLKEEYKQSRIEHLGASYVKQEALLNANQ